ncbi:MAG TPA: site-2 protease family protein [Acidimicrobiia bacterium]
MPVTVRTSFLVIAALIGFAGVGSPQETVAWIVIVFISILIHELGHAVTARMFGSEVAIELNGLGGLTRWNVPRGEITPGRRALIAAAGSATGLAFGGLVWVVAKQFGPYDPLIEFILDSIVYVNVFWGLLNWLPIRPLDGGHLLESLLEKVAPERAEMIAKVIFVVTAAGALVFAIYQRLVFIAVLAGWLLLSEFATSQGAERPATGIPTLSYDDADDEVVGGEAEENPPASSPGPTDN